MSGISAKAFDIAAREIAKLADNLSRPLADELFAVAQELKQRGEEMASAERLQAEANSFLTHRRSGAAGSSWPRIEKHLSKRA